jgi:prepilin-type processing-associated H-X9-DG protein
MYATGYPLNMYNPIEFNGQYGAHSQGSNYLFADGHCKWLLASNVSAGYNNGTSGNCGGGTTAANTNCSAHGYTWSIL